ncbi:MAG: alpha/beta hydrolase [Polyangiaceae bacterium]|nr:alpha/beta hydrolase [Polyangiaceae bacterium]
MRLVRPSFLIAAAALFVAVVVGARVAARHFLFPGGDCAPGPCPSGFVEHELTASDGVKVHALELPAPGADKTVVYFHNNRETIDVRADLARNLRKRGFGVLLVEYRGYGRSADGSACEEGLYLDAEAALDMLEARGETSERIVLWGTSLGTGVAAEMARRGRGAHLVLMTPYTSIPDLVTEAVPVLPASLLVPDHFDTLAKARQIHVPTLVIHGNADEIVPFWMGARLSDEIPNAHLVLIEGGNHGDLFARGGDDLLARVQAFARGQ